MNTKSRIASELFNSRCSLQHSEGEVARSRKAHLCHQLDITAALIRDGWVPFWFSSEYYGSHDECGEGNADAFYLFHPSIGGQVSQWESASFSHGHHGLSDSNERLQKWLDGLSSDLVVCLSK